MPDLVNNADPKLLDLKQQMVGEMAQKVRALAAKPDNLRLSLGVQKVEGESQPPKVVLWAPLQDIGMKIKSCIQIVKYSSNLMFRRPWEEEFLAKYKMKASFSWVIKFFAMKLAFEYTPQ